MYRVEFQGLGVSIPERRCEENNLAKTSDHKVIISLRVASFASNIKEDKSNLLDCVELLIQSPLSLASVLSVDMPYYTVDVFLVLISLGVAPSAYFWQAYQSTISRHCKDRSAGHSPIIVPRFTAKCPACTTVILGIFAPGDHFEEPHWPKYRNRKVSPLSRPDGRLAR